MLQKHCIFCIYSIFWIYLYPSCPLRHASTFLNLFSNLAAARPFMSKINSAHSRKARRIALMSVTMTVVWHPNQWHTCHRAWAFGAHRHSWWRRHGLALFWSTVRLLNFNWLLWNIFRLLIVLLVKQSCVLCTLTYKFKLQCYMHKHAKYGKPNKIRRICNNILYMQQKELCARHVPRNFACRLFNIAFFAYFVCFAYNLVFAYTICFAYTVCFCIFGKQSSICKNILSMQNIQNMHKYAQIYHICKNMQNHTI